jgi:hypothetical protein
MNYALVVVQMALGVMINAPTFITISSGVQKFLWGGYTYRHTNRQQGDIISLLLLSKARKIG